MALGITSAAGQKAYWRRNIRSAVSYDFPEGAAPLTALMSLMEPGNDTPVPEFGWPEERYVSIQTKTQVATQPTAGVTFYQEGGTTTSGAPTTVALGTNLRVYVDDVSNLQVDDIIQIPQVALTSGSDILVGRITALGAGTNAGTKWVEFAPQNVPLGVTATVLNTSGANAGKTVFLAGSAYLEGSKSRKGRSTVPLEVKNYVQLQLNAFALTSYALQAPTIYNKSGEYQKRLKYNGIVHLEGLEKTTIFGQRGPITTENDADSGDPMLRYTTGGILWYLKQWELGSSGDIGYTHVNGTDDLTAVPRADWELYPDKRIIQLDSATITKSQFNRLTARPFEKINSMTRDKLVLCGPDYLTKVAECFEKQVTWTSLRETGNVGWDFQLLKHQSNAGTVYYKVHPLFQHPVYRSCALYLDLGWLVWRPLANHDTQVMTNVQPKGVLYRKDQYLTAGGIEVGFPEAHMWVENLGGITGV